MAHGNLSQVAAAAQVRGSGNIFSVFENWCFTKRPKFVLFFFFFFFSATIWEHVGSVTVICEIVISIDLGVAK